jgi:hypothetical protein
MPDALDRDLFGERASTREEADEAMGELLATAQELVLLTDRHPGDSGADPALIEGWTTLLESAAEAIRVHLGEPRLLRHGVLVPVGYAARVGQ